MYTRETNVTVSHIATIVLFTKNDTFSVTLIALQFTSPPFCPRCAQTVICIFLDNEWLTHSVTDYLIDLLTGWLIDLSKDRLTGSFADGLCVTAASKKHLTEQQWNKFRCIFKHVARVSVLAAQNGNTVPNWLISISKVLMIKLY